MIRRIDGKDISNEFIKSIFKGTKIKVIIENKMNDYLKAHACAILPLVFACYKVNGNLKLLKKDKEYSLLIMDAIIEGYDVLKKLGYEILPKCEYEDCVNKKVIIITNSLREQSNSNLLAEAFKEGAEENKNNVEIISLKENRVAPCVGCGRCQVQGECFMKDKLNDILDKVIDADILVFASPTYYYSVSGTLKNFIDRTYAKFNKIKNKDFYYIGSGSDTSKESIDGAVETVKGFLRCVENVNLKGIVYGLSLNNPGDAKNSESLKQAHELGKVYNVVPKEVKNERKNKRIYYKQFKMDYILYLSSWIFSISRRCI